MLGHAFYKKNHKKMLPEQSCYILIQHAFLSLIFTSAIFQRIEYGRLREAFVASFFVAMQSVKKCKIFVQQKIRWYSLKNEGAWFHIGGFWFSILGWVFWAGNSSLGIRKKWLFCWTFFWVYAIELCYNAYRQKCADVKCTGKNVEFNYSL